MSKAGNRRVIRVIRCNPAKVFPPHFEFRVEQAVWVVGESPNEWKWKVINSHKNVGICNTLEEALTLFNKLQSKEPDLRYRIVRLSTETVLFS